MGFQIRIKRDFADCDPTIPLVESVRQAYSWKKLLVSRYAKLCQRLVVDFG